MNNNFVFNWFHREYQFLTFLSVFPAFFFSSCLNSGDDSSDPKMSEMSSSLVESSSSLDMSSASENPFAVIMGADSNAYSAEFKANYEILYYRYYKAGEELKSMVYYEENVNPDRYKIQFRDVADVLFMYADMSDLFTGYSPYTYAKEFWSELSGEGVDKSIFLDSVSGIPVIRITEFLSSTQASDSGTAGEFQSILKKTDGALSTVLDLRHNPGGSVDQCESMAAMLLPKGDTVIVEKVTIPDTSHNVQKDTLIYDITKADGIGSGRYYVLLLDTGSASCSEIFAAALTANLKSPVVGMTSFGKGIGQYYFLTPDSGLARVTALRFFDKDGGSYHGYGIVPDFEILDSTLALNKAVELAEEQTYRRAVGYGTTPLPYWQQVKAKRATSDTYSVQKMDRGGAYRIIPWRK